MTEVTSRGAAYLAGLAVGVWTGVAQLKELEQIDRRFVPQVSSALVARSRERWQRAISRCRDWEREDQP